MPKPPLNVKEENIERYFCEQVKIIGGIAEKVTVIGARGFFDRLAVLPGGKILLVEIKKPKGGRVSPHQIRRHMAYRALGVVVAVVKTRAEVDRLLAAYR
jgi:hypothetical protein